MNMWLKKAEGDKELYYNEWISLRETPDGYVYMHETRSDGQIVAVMVYNSDTQEILGRYERNPAHARTAVDDVGFAAGLHV